MIPTFDQLTSVNNAFKETEQQGEFVAAVFRIIISATMLVSIWMLVPSSQSGSPILMVAFAYGLVSIVGFGLAFVRIYHPILPFVFVLIDCAIIAIAISMLGHMRGMDMSAALSLPLFSLAFVILIHASLRFRPLLVAFAAVTLVGLVLATNQFVEFGTEMAMPEMHAMTTNPGSEFIPLMFFVLGAVLLLYIIRRTQNPASIALTDGKRVAQLTRFFSPEVAGRLVSEDYARGDYGGRQKVAVLFIDIRGFTSLAQDMSPEELTEFLSSFRRVVCDSVFEYGGTVDKFIGDAVLAVFGTPSTRSDDAKRAFDATLAISSAIHDWFDKRNQTGEPAALIGIGAHYGEVFAGVVESGEILEHTIIGDTVNVAQRLERLSRKFNSNFVISNELLAAAGVDPVSYGFSRKKNETLTGHDVPITIFHDELHPNASVERKAVVRN